MKKIKIKKDNYLYNQVDDTYSLYFGHSCEWYEQIRGTLAFEITDTGNGYSITQTKAKQLDYCEFERIKFLMNKIK